MKKQEDYKVKIASGGTGLVLVVHEGDIIFTCLPNQSNELVKTYLLSLESALKSALGRQVVVTEIKGCDTSYFEEELKDLIIKG